MFVNVKLKIDLGNRLVVPEDAEPASFSVDDVAYLGDGRAKTARGGTGEFAAVAPRPAANHARGVGFAGFLAPIIDSIGIRCEQAVRPLPDVPEHIVQPPLIR